MQTSHSLSSCCTFNDNITRLFISRQWWVMVELRSLNYPSISPTPSLSTGQLPLGRDRRPRSSFRGVLESHPPCLRPRRRGGRGTKERLAAGGLLTAAIGGTVVHHQRSTRRWRAVGDGAQDSRAARARPPAGARLQGRPQRLHLARWGGERRLGRQPCRACLRAPTPTAG